MRNECRTAENHILRKQINGPGRPPTAAGLRALIMRMAAENGGWGYTRIQRALQNLGHEIGRGTIAKVLEDAGVDPAPDRQKRGLGRSSCAPIEMCWP